MGTRVILFCDAAAAVVCSLPKWRWGQPCFHTQSPFPSCPTTSGWWCVSGALSRRGHGSPLTASCAQVFGLRNLGFGGTRHNVGEAFLDYVMNRLKAAPKCAVQDWHNNRSSGCDVAVAQLPVASLMEVGLVRPRLGLGLPPPARRPATIGPHSQALAPSSDTVSADTLVTFTLCKPRTLMNISGGSVKDAVNVTR